MIVNCLKCKLDKQHEAKGFCRSCYETERRKIRVRKKTVCLACKQLKVHHAKGYCEACYSKAKYGLEHLNNKAKALYKKDSSKAKVRALTRKYFTNKKTVCSNCGIKDKLEFHHTEYKVKSFIVLCHDCHKAVKD